MFCFTSMSMLRATLRTPDMTADVIYAAIERAQQKRRELVDT
jgi:hypothetical protein